MVFCRRLMMTMSCKFETIMEWTHSTHSKRVNPLYHPSVHLCADLEMRLAKWQSVSRSPIAPVPRCRSLGDWYRIKLHINQRIWCGSNVFGSWSKQKKMCHKNDDHPSITLREWWSFTFHFSPIRLSTSLILPLPSLFCRFICAI